ncbi:MAG: serine protease [Chthoniobacter sp.]|nr:serine protease [Chthoniobacter sp.]
MMISLRLFLCLLTAVFFGGCGKPPVDSLQGRAEPPPESWAALPPAQWPQLVLTNAAQFNGHTPLNGASSFLIRGGHGQILGATARHLLGENGGVAPTVEPARLETDLVSWRMFPRTKAGESVMVAGLASDPKPPRNLDWLLLALAKNAGKLPSYPLSLRSAPVAIGEEIFLVGVPYAEPNRAQNVYHGRVTARGFSDRFRYNVEPPVDIRGFSGAPILDRSGRVVGVMTVWFEPKMDGENTWRRAERMLRRSSRQRRGFRVTVQ